MQMTPSIIVVGLNYKKAPLEIREKILETGPFELARRLHFPQLMNEFIGLSTCNRAEIYAVTSNPAETARELVKLFDPQYTYVHIDEAATNHLYRVVSGLDSMILGEYDIVAQVKHAYSAATSDQTVGPILHQLFQRAVRASKVVRSSTKIGTGITSLARAAVDHAKASVDNLQDQSVLVVGAGSMAEKVGKYLAKEGVRDITYTNRTFARAESLAVAQGAAALPMGDIGAALRKCSIIISATASPGQVITRRMLQQAMDERMPDNLHIMDLAVPRDIDPESASIPGVELFNVDMLQERLDESKLERIDAAREADTLIELESQKFWDWHEARTALHGSIITA